MIDCGDAMREACECRLKVIKAEDKIACLIGVAVFQIVVLVAVVIFLLTEVASLKSRISDIESRTTDVEALKMDAVLMKMQLYGSNQAFGQELRRINKHTGMSRFEWNAPAEEDAQ